jgi:hypothetical protein
LQRPLLNLTSRSARTTHAEDDVTLHLLRRFLRAVALPPLAAIFLVEDVLIRSFGAAMGVLARLRMVAKFEAWAARLGPRQALLLFLLPVLVFLPVHLLALWAFATRRVLLGIAIYIAGKLAATAVVGRVLIVCRPALLRMGWFLRADRWVSATRTRLHTALAATAVWQAYLALRERFGRLGGGRRWWAAARRAVRG